MQKYAASAPNEVNFLGREKKVCTDVEAICVFTSTLEQIAIHILYRGVYGRPSWNTARSNIGVIFRINILQSFPWHSWVKLCVKHNQKTSVWSHHSPKLPCISRTQQIQPTTRLRDISPTARLWIVLPGGQFMLEPLEILSLSDLARDQLWGTATGGLAGDSLFWIRS